jgi:hypothetical protein
MKRVGFNPDQDHTVGEDLRFVVASAAAESKVALPTNPPV